MDHSKRNTTSASVVVTHADQTPLAPMLARWYSATSMLGKELAVARAAARDAARLIMMIYHAHDAKGHRNDGIDIKSDGSPLTVADRAANTLIVERLRSAFPEDGLLSEESADDKTRLHKLRVWMVDPLDGTRDFIARTGEFAVLIGLAIDGIPTLGVVYQPIGDALFTAVRGAGAHSERAGRKTPLSVSSVASLSNMRLGLTRTAVAPSVRAFIAASKLRVVHRGAALKYMSIAEGSLEASVTLSSAESEWDTCAPEIIVREAGGIMTDIDGFALRYNDADIRRRRGVIVSNGLEHDTLVTLAAPYGPAPEKP